jgi:hypothetical protein
LYQKVLYTESTIIVISQEHLLNLASLVDVCSMLERCVWCVKDVVTAKEERRERLREERKKEERALVSQQPRALSLHLVREMTSVLFSLLFHPP